MFSRINAYIVGNTRVRPLLALLLIMLGLGLTRGLRLAQYVTVDEERWLVRSSNFYQAVATGDLADTFQYIHPGVTVMWAGTAGNLLRYPTYAREAPGQFVWANDAYNQFIEQNGHQSIEMLVAGRIFVVLINMLILGGAFLYVLRLLGMKPALMGLSLIIFDPFQAAYSRFLHPDSLLSSFMLLSMLAFLGYVLGQRHPRDLIVSGATAGLALLTKTPALFLLPLIGLFSLVETVEYFQANRGQALIPSNAWAKGRRLIAPLLGWIAVALATFVALWPAMWVEPLQSLSLMLDVNSDYVTQGHDNPIFFNGRIVIGDPGLLFYPVTYLWRTTPITVVGLALAFIGLVTRRSIFKRRMVWYSVLLLLLHVCFFVVFMNFSAKKFDRYLLPIYMPLDLVAGVGYGALAEFVSNRFKRSSHTLFPAKFVRSIAYLILATVIMLQLTQALPTFPYYLSYYNPLMGGARRAPDHMLIGWGEGLDQAARYLNRITNSAETTVWSWYSRGPFSFFYDGPLIADHEFYKADYAAVYLHQWQRELPSREMLAYFNRLDPERTFTINDIEYVRLYNMKDALLPDYMVKWNNALQLVYFEAPTAVVSPGQQFDLNVYYEKVAPISRDWSLIVRVVNAEGDTLLYEEGWPNSNSTRRWDARFTMPTYYSIKTPDNASHGIYRIELSFYDSKTFDPIPIAASNASDLVASPYILSTFIVGEEQAQPDHLLTPEATLGNQAQLLGFDLSAGDDSSCEESRGQTVYRPGQRVCINLYWQALDFMYSNYTGFVHMVGADGLIAQRDQQPLDGFLPTMYWPFGYTIVDRYAFDIPAGTPSGEYALHAGLYQLDTLERLSVTRNGEPVGDSVVIATVTVE